MLIVSFIFLVIALILIGIGVVAGIVIFALVLGAGFLGAISVSAAVGLLQKKFSSGLRVLFYQMLVLSFAVAGMALTFLASTLLELRWDALSVVVVGGAAGISVGLLFGLLASWVIDVALQLLKRFSPVQDRVE
jgi:hypothetical protein